MLNIVDGKFVMSSDSVDGSFKTRITDLMQLNEALVKAVNDFYVEFGDNELEAVEMAYNEIVKLVSTKIDDALATPKQTKPNEEEIRIIDDALAMPLSEVVNLPKACYTNEFDLKVCSIKALLIVEGKVSQIEYALREVLYNKEG